MEETLAAAIRAEFVSLLADLEEERRDYRRRSALKQETQTALKEAETEVHGLHSERIALGKQFWKAYYGDDELSLSEYKRDSGVLERTIERAEKALEKARADFERANFDEDIEVSRLREKADAAQGETERRIAELEVAFRDAVASARSSIEEASKSLQDELETPRPGAALQEPTTLEEHVQPRQVVNDMFGGTATPRTAKPRRRWWLKWLSI